jgi:hypothetical protein
MRTSLLLLSLFAVPALAAPKVTVLPAHPLIEQTGRGTQSLNFDLLLENGEEKLELTGIEMTMFSPEGTFLGQQRLQRNGMSVRTLPDRELAPNARLIVFNPFHTLPDDLRLGRLRYELVFGDGTNDELRRAHVDVQPRAFTQKTVLELPVRGRVFVHDGHDFLSHHRRLDITGAMTTKLGIRTNMTRYAYDFVTVDGEGRMRKDKANDNGDWYCFGEPVFAPGDGVVVKATADEPDNDDEHPWRPDFARVLEDVHRIGGNHVLIDHGNGEYSWLAHLKQGSVTVKPGDRVKRGQRLGAIGRSGDAMFPHLHYQLQSDSYLGEGLPSAFSNFQRVTGGKPRDIQRGAVDTGDVLLVKGR